LISFLYKRIKIFLSSKHVIQLLQCCKLRIEDFKKMVRPLFYLNIFYHVYLFESICEL